VRLERAGAGFTPLRWQFRRPLLVLMSVVVLVLVIACANVANLLLARAVSRDREMAVRMALGSGRRRLMQQLLVESALLAAAGGVLGIGVAAFGSRIVATFLQTQELSVPVSPDLRVLAFTLAVSFLAAFIAGVIPAVTATRLDLARRDARAVGNVRLSTHHALVTAQVALSLVVVVVAGLFLRTLTGLQRLDIGFDRDQLITASLDVPRRSEPTAQLAMYQRMLDRLNAVAGQRAAISMFGMLSGNGWSDPIRVPGYTAREGEDLDVQRVIVSSRFFEVTGMRIVAGRPFGPTDDTIPTHAAIVNETVARRFFRGNAVGARFSMGDPYEVVGVVKDSFYRDLRAEAGVAAPIVYISALQAPGSAMAVQMRDVQVQLRVESAGDIEPAVRTALRDVDPGILVSEVRPMRAIVDRTIARERLLAQLAGWLGIVALALGAIGIYGVRAYAVNRRVSEFGVRMALGAAPRQIARGVVAQGVRVASIGIGIGLIGAAAVTPLVKGLLFGVAPLDLATFVTAAALFVGVAVTASYLPARRATRIDPVAALRSE
jgi:predicted permease